MQSLQAPNSQVFPPVHGTRYQAQVGHAAQHRLERNLAFESCERRTEAEVSAPRECEVPVILATDVKSISIRKSLGIAICSTHHDDNGLALTYRFPSHLYIIECQP